MSIESQYLLALLGFLVAMAVPVLLWLINSHIKMRNDLVRQEERLKHLWDVVWGQHLPIEQDPDRDFVASSLDRIDD